MQTNDSNAAPGADGKIYDVVIVGAGVSGGIIAMELAQQAQRNLQVLILEAGPPIPASRENYLDRYYNAYYTATP
jgi:glucose dehydrogenase